jgi:hypothetical protein
MPVTERVRGDVRGEVREHGAGWLALLGPLSSAHRLDQAARRSLVGRAAGQPGQVVGDQVGHLVADLPD